MNSLKELERDLKEKATKKSLIETLSNYINLGLKEFQKTVGNLLSVSSGEKNQISNELDKWEEKIR